MNTYLKKARLAFWKLGQPLTRIPQQQGRRQRSFYWRNTRYIQTF